MYIFKNFDILSPLYVSKMKDRKRSDKLFSSFDLYVTKQKQTKNWLFYFITFERVYM